MSAGRSAPSPRTRVRRIPTRGSYEPAVIRRILDEGLVAHVGFVHEGAPFVIPMGYARDGDRLLLHGSAASRLLRCLAAGAEACVTVTLLDALVLARSAFHHSMNYRSVAVLGRAEAVEEEVEKRRCLEVLLDRLVPGRGEHARPPDDRELAATLVVAVGLEEASAKVRSGPPSDDDEDLGLPHWAGLIPVGTVFGPPEAAPDLREGIHAPEHAHRYRRPGSSSGEPEGAGVDSARGREARRGKPEGGEGAGRRR